MRLSPSRQAAFWSRVDKRDADECWPWTGAKSKGYGRLEIDGRVIPATQIAWELANNKTFPEGMFACHSCDNPPCVNPAHIWPGTVGDNTLDAYRKGRLTTPFERGHHSRRWQSETHGHGKLCRRCGHLRTDDYLFGTRKNGKPHYACRPCERRRRNRPFPTEIGEQA